MSTAHQDKILLSRIAEGDEAAFRELFYRYGPILHPFVLNMVKSDMIAKEILQDVFLQVWLKRTTLTDIDNPASWLYTVATRRALNHLRRQRVEQQVLHSIRKSAAPETDTVTQELDSREVQQLIHRAVNELSPQRRRVFQLVREQGMSRKEAAEVMGISENAVRNYLSEALSSIQSFIRQQTGSYVPVFLLLYLFSR